MQYIGEAYHITRQSQRVDAAGASNAVPDVDLVEWHVLPGDELDRLLACDPADERRNVVEFTGAVPHHLVGVVFGEGRKFDAELLHERGGLPRERPEAARKDA